MYEACAHAHRCPKLVTVLQARVDDGICPLAVALIKVTELKPYVRG